MAGAQEPTFIEAITIAFRGWNALQVSHKKEVELKASYNYLRFI